MYIIGIGTPGIRMSFVYILLKKKYIYNSLSLVEFMYKAVNYEITEKHSIIVGNV